jgi:hypothetical protein
MIPGFGFLICAVMSYFKVYRPLVTRFKFDDAADRITLQRYACQCVLTDLFLGFFGLLVFPIAPFLQLFFCSNLRMVDSARIRVVRHGEKCSKAFSESRLGSSSVDMTVNVKTRGNGSLKQRRMTMGNKGPQEPLKRLVMPSPLPAVSVVPRAVTVMNYVTSPTLSPILELPEGEATEVAEAALIQIHGQLQQQQQQQQQQQSTAATGWHYLVGGGDEVAAAADEYFATAAGSVLLPPLGAQTRRNRATEAGMYRSQEMMSSAAGYFFTPPEASIEDPSVEDEEEDGLHQPGTGLHQISPKGSTPPPPPPPPLFTLPLPWPVPKCKQHHIPPEYYYPKKGQLKDDYWRLSCPLLTGLEAISGSGATSSKTNTRSGSRQEGGGESDSSFSSSKSSVVGNRDLKAMALARGCVSMSSALPVMRWLNRDVEYGGSLAAPAVYGYGMETDEDGEDEDDEMQDHSNDEMYENEYEYEYDEDEEEEDGLATQEEDLSSEDSGFGRESSSESDG